MIYTNKICLNQIFKDIEHQWLTLDVWDWIFWTDERLMWDKNDYDIDVIRVSPDRIWMPDIEIYNR